MCFSHDRLPRNSLQMTKTELQAALAEARKSIEIPPLPPAVGFSLHDAKAKVLIYAAEDAAYGRLSVPWHSIVRYPYGGDSLRAVLAMTSRPAAKGADIGADIELDGAGCGA
jgi:hypothetical protein